MNQTLEFIYKHVPWVFSGVGVAVLGGIITYTLKKKPLCASKLDSLHIDVKKVSIHVHNESDHYDNALSISLSNSGDSTIKIKWVFFKNSIRKYLFFNVKSNLQIYPLASKSADHDAYEIKFGEHLQHYKINIDPGEKVFTYLPLCCAVDQTLIDTKQCGMIVIEYFENDHSNTHISQI